MRAKDKGTEYGIPSASVMLTVIYGAVSITSSAQAASISLLFFLMLLAFVLPFIPVNYLTKQMSGGCKGMVYNHSWSGPSHHHSNPLFHLRPIAMYRTLLAGGLMLAITASVEPAVGIIQQIQAAWT